MTWITACESGDLAAGTPIGVLVDGDAICLVRAGGEVLAVDDECTHSAVPLSEGEVDGLTIECWMHGSRFDLRTGAALNLPATTPVRTYPVRCETDTSRCREPDANPHSSHGRPPIPHINVEEGHLMQTTSLTALVDEHLTIARDAASGRSAYTVHGGHDHTLRQTLIALASGRALDDHENPGEATLHVLHGTVRLTSGDSAWDGTAGDHLVIPSDRHALEALEDSVILLTVAMQV